MPQKGLIYRVLIASPSDCNEERSLIPKILHDWNASNSYQKSVILEPVMWESHVAPELSGSPQDIINRQLVDSCDILIGVFWSKIGTPTNNNISGTVEEIEKLRSEGKRTLLYFSKANIRQDTDLEQYTKLQKYKKKVRNQGIYFEYASVSDFKDLLRQHVSKIMSEIDIGATPGDASSSNSESGSDAFKSDLDKFYRKLKIEWDSEKESEPHSVEEAKYMMENVVDELIHFQSCIVQDPEGILIPKFKESIKKYKDLLKHKIYMDGGKSYAEFWNKGDDILVAIKSIVDRLNEQT